MVSASVGFQCPECTKEGAKASQSMRFSDLSPTSYATLTLIAINVIIFFVDYLGIGVQKNELGARWSLWEPAVAHGDWWRVLTSGFLHASLIHLAFNMFALYSIGTFLERTMGTVKYLTVYFVSLIGGSLGVILLSDNQPTVGASGAIFGIFGAFAVLSLSRGVSPMASGIGSTILLNLFITFTVPGISIGGHLGGLVAGAACGALFFGINPEDAARRRAAGEKPLIAQIGPPIALGLVGFLVCLLLAQSPF